MNKTYSLHLGDCLDSLRAMPDCSVDSIVTDPPYGLTANKKGGTGAASIDLESPYGRARIGVGNGPGGFMGMKWDSDVPPVEVWAECLRVLKPGGHLLAFAGTRTQHRMAVRIEDAGFEIRDMIAWVYGSGFPKSLDVSKAIDKAGPPGQAPFAEFAQHYESRRKALGMTHAQVCEAGKWYGNVNHGGSSANWANGYGFPTVEQWAILQPLLGLDEKWKERVERVQYEREVLGIKPGTKLAVAPGQENDRGATDIAITAAGSDAARQWQGWGTALKPALEPITVARKPFRGTVAANVLAHGTGALNIDGCRVPTNGEVTGGSGGRTINLPDNVGAAIVIGRSGGNGGNTTPEAGRWPANLIHDGSDDVLAGFPDSKGSDPARTLKRGERKDGEGWGMADEPGELRDAGSGSAARFFYCAKASRADRNEGLTDPGPQFKHGATLRQVENTDTRGNHHPTVKPTDLMAYLVRLVTPPGGVVLDPFMGSGSTGKAAMREGFRFIGCELSPEYLAIAEARISHELARIEAERASAAAAVNPQFDLFAQA